MVTTNVNIVTDCGRFELNQGFWNKNNTCIWLQVLKISKYSQEVRAKDYDIWDNEVFLKKLFKQIKNKNKKGAQYFELKKYCQEIGWNPKEIKKILKALYKESKRVGFNWKLIKD